MSIDLDKGAPQKIEVTGSTVPKRACRTVAEPVKPKEAEQAATGAPPSGGTN